MSWPIGVERQMNRVFVTEKPIQDISVATKFGTIEYLLTVGHKSTWKTDKLTALFLQKLDSANYDPDSDYVLVVGSSILLTTLVAAIASEYGALKVLCYHTTSSQYVERIIGTIDE
jgi:hypothetical protein